MMKGLVSASHLVMLGKGGRRWIRAVARRALPAQQARTVPPITTTAAVALPRTTRSTSWLPT